jgi:pilus assembly protein CpaF
MIKLTLTEKGGEPKALSFDKDEVSIGRVSGNDIVLPKGNVSKRHSKIVQRDGRLEVADLRSTNGTYVNGRKIADPTAVTAADKIYVGDFMIAIEGEATAAAAGHAQGQGNGQSDRPVSSARKLPIPPPPPLPASRSNSALARVPAEDDDNLGADEEDESLGLAVRPPGAGRMPPPPPPPSARRTPIGNPVEVDEDAFGADEDVSVRAQSAPPYQSEADEARGEGGSGGGPALFERAATRADDIDEDDFKESAASSSRSPSDLLAATLAPDGFSARPPSQTIRPLAEVPSAPMFDRGGSSKLAVVPELAQEGGGGAEARPPEGLDALMADPAVSAIFILGPETTLVERDGKIEPFATSLGDPNTVADMLWRIATSAVPPPAPDNPVIDVRLLDGTRVAAVFPPAAPAGLCAAIRKAALPANRTLAELGPAGTVTKEVQSLLEAAVSGQRNVLLTGDAGAVAVVLGAVSGAIAAERRVVSIGVGSARARAGWTELAPSNDMPALVRVAAAFRADHLLVAEVGGPEVIDLLTAAARGQDGLVFGFPARSASEALARLEALASRNAGAAGVPRLLSSTLDLVVHAVSLAAGGVRVTEITETKVDSHDRLGTDPVLVWRGEGERRGGSGKQQVTGVSSGLAAALAASGSALPASLLRK